MLPRVRVLRPKDIEFATNVLNRNFGSRRAENTQFDSPGWSESRGAPGILSPTMFLRPPREQQDP